MYETKVNAFSCIKDDNQAWIFDEINGRIRNKKTGECLTSEAQLEIWAGPLSDGSQAVLLLNRVNNGSEPITVQWNDIDFPVNQPANVRDLWQHKDLGTFIGNYTSPNITAHSVMMLKVTPTIQSVYHL